MGDPKCGKSYTRTGGLHRHQRMNHCEQHEMENLIVCEELDCMFRCLSAENLREHVIYWCHSARTRKHLFGSEGGLVVVRDAVNRPKTATRNDDFRKDDEITEIQTGKGAVIRDLRASEDIIEVENFGDRGGNDDQDKVEGDFDNTKDNLEGKDAAGETDGLQSLREGMRPPLNVSYQNNGVSESSSNRRYKTFVDVTNDEVFGGRSDMGSKPFNCKMNFPKSRKGYADKYGLEKHL